MCKRKTIERKWEANDIPREVTIMYNLVAKCLWQWKIKNKSNISYTNSDSETYILKY